MRKGFTLIELSIVLVIIGLLIGGILVAQTMISTTKAGRLVRDIQQYQAATVGFFNTYKSLPGDWPNAVSIIDGACSNGNNNPAAANGDGDGIINKGVATGWEYALGMCQITLLKFIDSPKNVLADYRANLSYSKNAYLYYNPYGGTQCGMNIEDSCLLIGGTDGFGYGAIIPRDAMAVDAKIDDANAATGNILGFRSWQNSPSDAENCGDFIPGSNYASNYHTDSSTGSCQIAVKILPDSLY